MVAAIGPRSLSRRMRTFLHLLAGISFIAMVASTATAPAQESNRESQADTVATPEAASKDSRGLFSPRMDYDEWTPLGRGDPLKNEPTYVYVPPVLERVHYWVDPSSRTPDPPLPGSMTLGQSSLERHTRPHQVPILRATQKKLSPTLTTVQREATVETRRDPFDPFLKFIDAPKFSSTPLHYYHQRPSNPNAQAQRNQYLLQPSYYPSTYHQKPRPNIEVQQSYSSEIHSTELFPQREPYTMLVPPPLQVAPTFSMMDIEMTTTISTPTTKLTTLAQSSPTSVDVSKGSLVYHTSTMPDWVEGKTQLATIAAASNQVTWKIPTAIVHAKLNQMSGNANRSKFEAMPAAENVSSTIKVLANPVAAKDLLKSVPPLDGMGPLLASLLKDESWTTSAITPPPNIITMTTIPSLTTDPLFSHYKQPAEPIKGPMYLIIQGHSKVKTYGAVKPQTYHGIPLQETNEISQASEGEIDRSGREVEDDYVEYDGKESDTEMVTNKAENCEEGCGRKEEFKRSKRQLELIDDLLPIEDAAEFLDDFLVHQIEGSGVGGSAVFAARRSKRTLGKNSNH